VAPHRCCSSWELTPQAWPDVLMRTLGEHHRVIRYDHRDTGRSSWVFDEHPYAVSELAEDAIARGVPPARRTDHGSRWAP